MQKLDNAKIKMWKIKRYYLPLLGSSPKLARLLWSGVVPHVLPIGRLCVMMLLQHRIQLSHLLLLLLMPMCRILQMSIKCILNLTGADFQSSEVGVDIFPFLTV